jgi:hypothetical protein
MISATSGWAVGGDDDKGVIINANGSTWSQWTKISLDSDVNSITLANANDALAVGDDGLVLSWDGTTWMEEDSGTTKDLDGVFMLHISAESTDVAWAVGSEGTILGWIETD